MSILTPVAVLALAATCQHVVAPKTMLDIIQVGENHNGPMNDHAISPPNKDGSRDYGLAQINDRNFTWLKLTRETALDPCLSIAAEAEVLTAYSRYNSGLPTSPIGLAYAQRVIMDRKTISEPAIIEINVQSCAPQWDAWALAACNNKGVKP
jgi:Transglycosylase SLT domain